MKKKFFLFLSTLFVFIQTTSGQQLVIQRHLTTADGLPSNTVRHIMQDSYGYLWFSTTNGLSRYDGYSIRNYRRAEGLKDVRISYTREQADHSIAIVTTRGEVYRLAQGADTVVWLMNDLHELRPEDSAALRDSVIAVYSALGGDHATIVNAILYVIRDRSGSVWVGTEQFGCEQLVDYQQQWATVLHPMGKKANDPHSDDDNWRYLSRVGDQIETGNLHADIVVYDSTMTKVVQHKKMSGNIYCSAQDYHGKTVYGIRKENDIYDFLTDRKGRLWTATLGKGLSVYSPKGELIGTYLTERYSLSRVRSLQEDKHGYLWAGTSEGLVILHPDSILRNPSAYRQYTTRSGALRSDEIRCVYISADGEVYLSEAGEGFSRTRVPEKAEYTDLVFDHYNQTQGLANNMVQSFLSDKEGNIWMSTEYGLSRFDKQSKAIVSYMPMRQMSNMVFSEQSALRLPDGKLVFGSSNGLMMIDPAQIPPVKAAVVPRIVDYKVTEDGTLTASFSTFHYAAHIRDQYAFRLAPRETTFSPASSQNSVVYPQLEPGEYQLYAKALNEDGQWSEAVVMKIVVPAMWWESRLAITLYWVGGLIVLALLIYLTWSRVRLHNRMKMDEKITEAKLVFFTNISHEFRTPLTLIHGTIEHLQKADGIPADEQSQLKVLKRNSDRLMRLIDQLLEFRRMQNKVMTVRVEPIEVIGLLRELGESFRQTAESKNLQYRFVCSQDAQQAWVDRSNLDKVFYNLLSNAIKYTPDGGEVSMECIIFRNDKGNRWLRVAVKDTGVGVDKAKRDHIFDQRFVQSMQLRRSMGIGLNLCAALVDVHHGTIRLEPNSPQGSVFIVEIPIERSAYSEAEIMQQTDGERMIGETEESIIEKPLNTQRLLLIEDDDDMREYVRQELSTYFEVQTAPDGESGLKILEAEHYDLVVTDLMMPGISGMEVIRAIRENIAISHLPIVLLTAKDSVDCKIEGMQSGADAYITKPFSTRLLVATIVNLINQRAQLREKFSNDLSMLHPVVTTSNADKTFFEQLDALVDENLDNSEISVDVFARKMLLGRTVFFRKVKEVTGYSPKEYLRVRRMKRAAELLQEGKLSVSEIAYTVGMSDPFYFSKCFKQQFGMAPSAYQKECTKNQIN